MHAAFAASSIFMALFTPMFFALALPIIAASAMTLGYDKNNFFKSLNHPLIYTTILVIICLFASTFISTHPLHSIHNVAQLSLMILLFAILWCMYPKFPQYIEKKYKILILGFYIVCLTILMSLNIAMCFEWHDWDEYKLNRQAVIFALFLWTLLLSLYDEDLKYLVYLVITLTVISIFLGNSQTAQLMLLGGISAFLLFKVLPKINIIRNSVFTLMILFISLLPLILALINSPKFAQISKPFLGDKVHHLHVWVISTKKLIAEFPTGIGAHTTQFLRNTEGQKLSIHHPHNFIMELGLELGIIGILIAILCIYAAISLFQKTHHEDQPVVAASLISLLILYSTAFSIWQEWRTGFVVSAFILLKRYLRLRKSDRETTMMGEQPQTQTTEVTRI